MQPNSQHFAVVLYYGTSTNPNPQFNTREDTEQGPTSFVIDVGAGPVVNRQQPSKGQSVGLGFRVKVRVKVKA